MAAQKAFTCNSFRRVMMNSDGMMRAATERISPHLWGHPSRVGQDAQGGGGISFRVQLSPCFMNGSRQNDGYRYYMQ